VDLPLLSVPWDVWLADMIKDLSIRIFLQGAADEQISAAFIRAIEQPDARDQYESALLPYYDTDGTFQLVVFTTGDLDKMDTVERRRIAYRMQLYFTNLTHNGHFLYYDSCFIVLINALAEKESRSIIESFLKRAKKRMPDLPIHVGVSPVVTDISSLSLAYRRGRAALRYALDTDTGLVYFDDMKVQRLLYSVPDAALLEEFSAEILGPLIAYDKKHGADFVHTLEVYLECGESVRLASEKMYIHRNTIAYRMQRIRELLDNPLTDPDDKLNCRLACMILHMQER